MIVKNNKNKSMFIRTLEAFKKAEFLDIMAVDTETTSLNPREAELEGIGWGDGKKQYYIDWATCDFKEEVLKKFVVLFENNTIIFHNAKFDIKIFKIVLGVDYPKKIHDTMIMSWLLDENISHSLKELTKNILKRKVVTYNEVVKEPNLFQDIDAIKNEMAKYCCSDVKNTFDLYTKFYPQMVKEDLIFCYSKIEIPLIKILADMESRGVKIDINILKELSKKAEAILLEKEALIKGLVGLKKFNPRSSKQLRDVIFDKLGVKPERITPRGSPSTDHESLKILAKKNNAVQAILDFREFDKLNGTYLLGLQEKAEKGILYTDFMQHRTRSGRLASAHPNLQNIPARADDFNIRKAFVPRKGYKFIISDYSQIELRMVAYYSQEPAMIKIFKEGGDIHQLTADMVGCLRQQAKGINFGLIYGLGAKSLARDLEISVEQAQSYMNTFFAKFTKLTSYITYIQTIGFFKGYIDTLARRRRRFKITKSMSRKDKESTKRKLINTKIQGSAADLMKIAMIRLDKVLKEKGAHLLLQIHDEVVVEAPIDKVEEIKKLVSFEMGNAIKLNIPIPAEAKIADCWIK